MCAATHTYTQRQTLSEVDCGDVQHMYIDVQHTYMCSNCITTTIINSKRTRRGCHGA